MKKRNGFSLIEVLISMGIIGLITMFFCTLLVSNSQGLMRSNNTVSGATFAISKLNYWQQKGYTWITGSHIQSDLSGLDSANGTSFAWSVVPTILPNGVAQVDVKIVYQPNSQQEYVLWVNQ